MRVHAQDVYYLFIWGLVWLICNTNHVQEYGPLPVLKRKQPRLLCWCNKHPRKTLHNPTDKSRPVGWRGGGVTHCGINGTIARQKHGPEPWLKRTHAFWNKYLQLDCLGRKKNRHRINTQSAHTHNHTHMCIHTQIHSSEMTKFWWIMQQWLPCTSTVKKYHSTIIIAEERILLQTPWVERMLPFQEYCPPTLCHRT